MTPEQKNLIRDSFAQVEPISAQAAALFYDRLFTVAPSVKPLFNTDMTKQGNKLMQTIGVAVAHLDNLQEIVPILHQLGERHVAYGAQPEHYAVVGEALLWTLEQGLGDAFTPEVKEAWTAVYTLLANTMLEATTD